MKMIAEMYIADIRRLRVKADWLVQNTVAIRDVYQRGLFTNDVDNAFKSLQMGRAWLGKSLSVFSTESGYAQSPRLLEDIQPQADASTEPFAVGMGHIPDCAFMRDEIQKLIGEVAMQIRYSEVPALGPPLFRANEHFTEARFWYGYALQAIKKEAGK